MGTPLWDPTRSLELTQNKFLRSPYFLELTWSSIEPIIFFIIFFWPSHNIV